MLLSSSCQQLPEASEHPCLPRHASYLGTHPHPSGETHACARHQDKTQSQKENDTRAQFWRHGVGNTCFKRQELWTARPQWLPDEKDTQAQVLAVPSNICLPCMAHLGTPVHVTSAQLWHSGTRLYSHAAQQQLMVHKPG